MYWIFFTRKLLSQYFNLIFRLNTTKPLLTVYLAGEIHFSYMQCGSSTNQLEQLNIDTSIIFNWFCFLSTKGVWKELYRLLLVSPGWLKTTGRGEKVLKTHSYQSWCINLSEKKSLFNIYSIILFFDVIRCNSTTISIPWLKLDRLKVTHQIHNTKMSYFKNALLPPMFRHFLITNGCLSYVPVWA